VLADGSKISARPSGTEPKIKFYFSVNSKMNNAAGFNTLNAMLEEKIKAIINDMKL
jgi:phosphoglucomutase